MQYHCTKCGSKTTDSGDIHCRKIFRDELKKLLALNEYENAKEVYVMALFDENWKERLLHSLGGRLKELVEENKEREETLKRHKKHLVALNIGYLGVSSVPKAQKYRISHCYKCKKEVDSKLDIECNICGWIICDWCGACGCGYSNS